MADRRRVSVHLELEVAAYLRDGKTAAAVTRTVSSAVDDLGDEADATGRDMLQLAANTDIASRRVDDLGDEALGAAADLAVLKTQLDAVDRAARGIDIPIIPGGGRLAVPQIDGGGGDSVGVGLGAAIGTRAGQSAGAHMAGGISDALSGARFRAKAIGALVLLGVAASPTLGAMISGAVIGTAGLGGIAGGILAASKDPAVRQAASVFGRNVSSSFFQSGDAFIEPIVESLPILQEAFNDLRLEEMFGKVSGYVDDIAIGLRGFSQAFSARFLNALDEAGPLIELLGRELPKVGDALGYMFETMAKGEGTLEGGLFLLGFLEANLKGIGNILGWLSDRFAEMNQTWAEWTGVLEDIGGPFQGVFQGLNNDVETFIQKANVGQQVAEGLAKGYVDMSQSAADAKRAIDQLNAVLFEQHDAALGAEEAALRQAEAFFRLRESVKEHGTSLLRSTEIGLANHNMINGLVRGVMDIHEANIAAQMPVEQANRLYQQQIVQLQLLLQQMGFNEAQIDDLVGAYKRIPTRITTQIITQYQQQGKPPGEHSGVRSGERSGRAAGGPVLAGRVYQVEEQVAETFRPGHAWMAPADGMVMPLSGGMSQPYAGSGGTMRVVVEVVPGATMGHDLGDAIVNNLTYRVETQGGGSVDNLLSRRRAGR